MSCEQIRGLLIPYTESQCDAESARQVEEHLAVCAECRKELELLTKSWRLLELYKPIEPSDMLKHRILARQRRTVWLKKAIPVASVAAAVLLALTLLLTKSTPETLPKDMLEESDVTESLDLVKDRQVANVLEEFLQLEEMK